MQLQKKAKSKIKQKRVKLTVKDNDKTVQTSNIDRDVLTAVAWTCSKIPHKRNTSIISDHLSLSARQSAAV